MAAKVLDKEVKIISTEICEAFTIKLRSDGIVHSHTSGTIEWGVESLKKFTIVMGKMINHGKAPLLITNMGALGREYTATISCMGRFENGSCHYLSFILAA